MQGQTHGSGRYRKGERKGFSWRINGIEDGEAAEIKVGGSRFCLVNRLSKREVTVVAADFIP